LALPEHSLPSLGTIAITDLGWYSFLSARPEISEVNFWTPSARRAFKAPVFSPFFFKLRAPHNAICGFAWFAQYSVLPDWLAWETFGEGNGCSSFDEMRDRIGSIRERIRYDEVTGSDNIGCIQLSRRFSFRVTRGFHNQPTGTHEPRRQSSTT
jgi:putative restriction endonuclease